MLFQVSYLDLLLRDASKSQPGLILLKAGIYHAVAHECGPGTPSEQPTFLCYFHWLLQTVLNPRFKSVPPLKWTSSMLCRQAQTRSHMCG